MSMKEVSMNQRLPLSSISQETLKGYHIVRAIDRNDPDYYVQVWGQDVVPPITPYGSGAHEINTLSVEIDSKNDEQLQELFRLVESAHGQLPNDVKNLRKPSRKEFVDVLHKVAVSLANWRPQDFRKPDGRPNAEALTSYMKRRAGVSSSIEDDRQAKVIANHFENLEPEEKTSLLNEALSIY
jgi:hypothetical protein